MSRYTVNKVLERLWYNFGDKEDISGDEFDNESDEDYHDKSGPHRGEKMARSERVKTHIQCITMYKQEKT